MGRKANYEKEEGKPNEWCIHVPTTLCVAQRSLERKGLTDNRLKKLHPCAHDMLTRRNSEGECFFAHRPQLCLPYPHTVT